MVVHSAAHQGAFQSSQPLEVDQVPCELRPGSPGCVLCPHVGTGWRQSSLR
jgi:hypothetical protein